MDLKRQFNARTTVTKTSAYTALVTDGYIKCSGTFSLTLFARSALTDGQSGHALRVNNTGTGIISIVPATGETVNYVNGYALNPGDEVIITYEYANQNWTVARRFVEQDYTTGIRSIVVNTNGTTAVDVFGAGGAPHAMTILHGMTSALDTTDSNVILTNAGDTVFTIAKGTTDGAVVAQSALANTAVAKNAAVQVDGSSAGDAVVMIWYSIGAGLAN